MNAEYNLNLDFSQPLIIHSDDLPWVASPQSGVERRQLERESAESGHVTTIVRYQAGVSFPHHTHTGGEEYWVLEGTFSDQDGDFPKGSYVRNPPGTSHQPFSQNGCTIFVKLCQMQPTGEPHIAVNSPTKRWQPGLKEGHTIIALYHSEAETVSLEKFTPGTDLGKLLQLRGEEILVIDGELVVNGVLCGPRTWIRNPAGSWSHVKSHTDCTIWTKRGHLLPSLQ